MGYISTVVGNLNAKFDGGSYNILTKTLDELNNYKQENSNYGGYWLAEINHFYDEEANVYAIYVEYSHSGKAYEIEKEVKEVVNILSSNGFNVNGKIMIVGEDTEAPDWNKVSVKDNSVSLMKGKVSIVFPDGEIIET